MIEDDEKGTIASHHGAVRHDIGQPLDSLSAAEIGERIELLRSEIRRLEEARQCKQRSQAAAAAFFKI